MSQPNTFTLYNLNACPFCHNVRAAAAQLGIPLNLVNIVESDAARRKLIDFRGRATVPVLGIPQPDGSEKLLGESRDIIAYLQAVAADKAA